METISIDFRKALRWGGRIFVTVCLAGSAICQTQVDLRSQSKNIDFTSALATKPFKTGNVLPATCNTAEAFFNLNAQPGQNLFVCTSLNTWSPASANGGIVNLNGLNTSSQTFGNDTNVTVVSNGTSHTITWSGRLAKLRQHAATVYTDQANTFAGAFVQDFSAISHVRLPVSPGYTPTATGHLGFDSTANVYKVFNGTAVKSLAFLDSNITGTAATATAFAVTPTKCPPGNYPLGIDAAGNAQNCTAPSGNGDSAGQTTVPFSATPTYAVTRNSFEAQKLTLTGNITSSSLTVASGNPVIELVLCQDATGGRTNVWPPNVNGAPVISLDPNSCTNIAGNWNGSAMQVYFYNVTNSAAAPALVYQISGTTYTQTLSAQNGIVATLADVAAGGGNGTVTLVSENWIPFGICNSSGQNFPQVNTPLDSSLLSCSNDGILLTFDGTGTHPITFGFRLPATWTSSTSINLSFSWFENSSGDTTKVAAWNGAIKCMSESGGFLGAGGVMTLPSSLADYNTPSASSSPLPPTQSLTKVSLNGLTSTGCTPGSLVFGRIERDNTVANNDPSPVRVVQGLNVTYTRTAR